MIWVSSYDELMEIERRYIVDEHNRKIAVQLDLKTFEVMEEILENYGLVQLMREDKEDDELLHLGQANAYYQALKKAK
jgi:hypothetical protein